MKTPPLSNGDAGRFRVSARSFCITWTRRWASQSTTKSGPAPECSTQLSDKLARMSSQQPCILSIPSYVPMKIQLTSDLGRNAEEEVAWPIGDKRRSQGAKMQNAYLNGANLRGTNLCAANLTNVMVSDRQLEMAKTNWWTILPNGKRGSGF